MPMYFINDTGRREIAEFLAARHKHFAADLLDGWLTEAENADPPMIEIPAHDSVSGAPETLRISEAGYETQTLD